MEILSDLVYAKEGSFLEELDELMTDRHKNALNGS